MKMSSLNFAETLAPRLRTAGQRLPLVYACLIALNVMVAGNASGAFAQTTSFTCLK